MEPRLSRQRSYTAASKREIGNLIVPERTSMPRRVYDDVARRWSDVPVLARLPSPFPATASSFETPRTISLSPCRPIRPPKIALPILQRKSAKAALMSEPVGHRGTTFKDVQMRDPLTPSRCASPRVTSRSALTNRSCSRVGFQLRRVISHIGCPAFGTGLFRMARPCSR